MNTPSQTPSPRRPFFARRPLLLISLLLVLAGYLLMSGPASTQQVFNPDIFSPRRIVLAPLLCLAGYLLIIVAILRR